MTLAVLIPPVDSRLDAARFERTMAVFVFLSAALSDAVPVRQLQEIQSWVTPR